jgi:hypothetical protein
MGYAWSGVSAKINPNLTLKLKLKVGHLKSSDQQIGNHETPPFFSFLFPLNFYFILFIVVAKSNNSNIIKVQNFPLITH